MREIARFKVLPAEGEEKHCRLLPAMPEDCGDQLALQVEDGKAILFYDCADPTYGFAVDFSVLLEALGKNNA